MGCAAGLRRVQGGDDDECVESCEMETSGCLLETPHARNPRDGRQMGDVRAHSDEHRHRGD